MERLCQGASPSLTGPCGVGYNGVYRCGEVMAVDRRRFERVRDEVLRHAPQRQGIGTLGEKALHMILKRYMEPFEGNHETKIGPYVADIVGEEGVVEIQTGAFNRLRPKLEALLPVARVTVVYPIPHRKWLTWLDPETGEAIGQRKSPKQGSFYHAFYELYKIKSLLTHPNLRLHLLLLDMEEYRRLDGWSYDRKRGSTRHERIPLALVDELRVEGAEDYQQLLPRELPESFTSADYARVSRLRPDGARTALNVLRAVGAVEREGKQGRLLLYRRAGESPAL